MPHHKSSAINVTCGPFWTRRLSLPSLYYLCSYIMQKRHQPTGGEIGGVHPLMVKVEWDGAPTQVAFWYRSIVEDLERCLHRGRCILTCRLLTDFWPGRARAWQACSLCNCWCSREWRASTEWLAVSQWVVSWFRVWCCCHRSCVAVLMQCGYLKWPYRLRYQVVSPFTYYNI